MFSQSTLKSKYQTIERISQILVGCIRLTEGNREVGTVFRFLTECTRMSVNYFVFTDSIQFLRTNQLDSIKTVKYFSRNKINLI